MNPGVSVKIGGLTALLAKFASVKPAKLRSIERKGLEKAARIVVRAIKANLIPGQFGYATGALKMATYFKTGTNKAGKSYAICGARRAIKRVVRGSFGTASSPTKFGKRLRGKRAGKNPAAYAHLIEFGHRIAAYRTGTLARASGKAAAKSRVTGRVGEGTKAGFVPGIAFMRRAYDGSIGAAKGAIKAHMCKELFRQLIFGK